MLTKRKTPQRKCIVTNEMKPKKELIRIVRNKEGDVFVDETGKQNGRGAYLTMDKEIIEKAQETNVLERTLKTKIDSGIYEELKEIVNDK